MSKLNQCIANRNIAMGMKLHGMTDDIGNFIIPSVLQPAHRVEDSALNGLKSIVQVGYSPFQNYVRGILEEPIFIHTRKVGNILFTDTPIILSISLPIKVNIIYVLLAHFFISCSKTSSSSILRFPIIKSCRSGVFFPI